MIDLATNQTRFVKSYRDRVSTRKKKQFKENKKQKTEKTEKFQTENSPTVS